MIVKTPLGYTVKSEKTGRKFGTYDSKEKAKKRLSQIEMFKAIKRRAKK